MFVHFRKRLNQELLGKINERIVLKLKQEQQNQKPGEEKVQQQQTATADRKSESPQNQGKLIKYATCAPADINYPTDLKLLNHAREQTEKLIAQLDDRIVSLTQPHLRPIVRGKAGNPVEFERGGRCEAKQLVQPRCWR